MTALTDRQQEVLDFIEQFTALNGFAPTVREIAGYFGFQTNAIAGHLQALKLKGRVDWHEGMARTLRVPKP